jgi:hypothetical protein
VCEPVSTLASPFIKSCASTNPPLPVKAFLALSLAIPGPIKANSTIVLQTTGYVLADPSTTNSTQLYGAFITVTGPVFANATQVPGGYSLVVPQGVNSQSYVVITSCTEKVSDATTAAGLLSLRSRVGLVERGMLMIETIVMFNNMLLLRIHRLLDNYFLTW